MARTIEHFTSSGRQILRLSQNIAIRLQHDRITPDHLLLAMARAADTNAYFALQDVDIIEGKLARYLSVVHPASNDHPLRFDGVQFADETQQLFHLSRIDATLRGDDYIASTHLLIGMMRLPNALIDDVLTHFSLDRKTVIKAAEYYFEYSIEVPKHRIPIALNETDDPIGCLAALRDALNALIRKR